MEQTFSEVKLTSKKEIAVDVLQLRFEKPINFSFKAGQFVQFQIPTPNSPALRSYSLSSTPSDSELELCIKKIPNGTGSTFFDSLPIGGSVNMSLPKGRFTVEANNLPLAFIATGAGLAPIMSIICDELKNKKNPETLHLLFGVRNEKDIFWLDRLNDLQKNYPNFKYQITLSQPEQNWQGLSGRVTNHFDFENIQYFYLCGNTEMVKDARELLITKNIPASQIHFEIF
jgi:ferredoxin-NADP reductase